MIIDCHGHYTTAPKALEEFRKRQIEALDGPSPGPRAEPEDQRRPDPREPGEGPAEAAARARHRSHDLLAAGGGMGHHIGDPRPASSGRGPATSSSTASARLIRENFVGVCQLPQSPGVPPANCIAELERCVKEFGFIGCNLNPDPSGGYWTDPPLTDNWWYPLYEKMVELDVPAMVHVSSLQPEFPRHRRALHQRRHHRVHAVPAPRTCSRISRR